MREAYHEEEMEGKVITDYRRCERDQLYSIAKGILRRGANIVVCVLRDVRRCSALIEGQENLEADCSIEALFVASRG